MSATDLEIVDTKKEFITNVKEIVGKLNTNLEEVNTPNTYADYIKIKRKI